jgi:hypothetical protein
MGFIGIDRGLREHWIYQDAEYLKVWMEMLFLARFSEEPHTELIDGDIIQVEYGQFIFGRVKWSQRLKVGEQRLRTLMNKLKKEQMIELVLEHRKCSVYALCNYAKFNQQTNHQSSLTHQDIEAYANHQSNQQLTISQPSVNHQLTTKEQGSNKDNKVNKVKEKKIAYSENVTLTETEYQNLCEKYGKELADSSISYLTSYKIEKGYKTKSDNLTIQRWVIEATKKTKVKAGDFGEKHQGEREFGRDTSSNSKGKTETIGWLPSAARPANYAEMLEVSGQ